MSGEFLLYQAPDGSARIHPLDFAPGIAYNLPISRYQREAMAPVWCLVQSVQTEGADRHGQE